MSYENNDVTGAVACMQGGDGRWLGFSTRPELVCHVYTRLPYDTPLTPDQFDVVLNGAAVALTPRNQ